MAKNSQVEDDELCEIATETEMACTQSVHQLSAVQQLTGRPLIASLPDCCMSERPGEFDPGKTVDGVCSPPVDFPYGPVSEVRREADLADIKADVCKCCSEICCGDKCVRINSIYTSDMDDNANDSRSTASAYDYLVCDDEDATQYLTNKVNRTLVEENRNTASAYDDRVCDDEDATQYLTNKGNRTLVEENQSTASAYDDRVCDDEDATQYLTNKGNHTLVEENPRSCNSRRLSNTDVATKRAVDGYYSDRRKTGSSAQVANADEKSDDEGARDESFAEKLSAKCSAKSRAIEDGNTDGRDPNDSSAENPKSSKPGELASDGKPHQLSFSSDVLLVAPTGKAANVLGRRTGIQAFTMHHVIFSYRAWKRSERWPPVMWKFQMVQMLVVDEGSLVAVTTFHSLISKVLPSLRKVVLLGDILQLPSIEPGTPP